MRVVVVGATGNVGTTLVRALADDPAVDSVLGLARRLPELDLPTVEWAAADVSRDALLPYFRDADCVVHLAWLIQPSHDRSQLWRVNVGGSDRVLAAVAEAGVRSLVFASSVGVYSPGPKDREVDERWPREGIATSQYSLQKAECERRLDRFERDHPDVRVVRLRPALIFKRTSADEQRRLFAGRLFPPALVRRGLIPVVPDTPGLAFQAVHTEDVADAYRRAVLSDARGAFNVAAPPRIDADALARLLGARKLPVPAQLLRGAAQLTWRLHLQPSSVGWVDMGLSAPLLDTTRIRGELGWEPLRSGIEALSELLDGIRDRAGEPTPPLQPA